jgi:hypothetical protein
MLRDTRDLERWQTWTVLIAVTAIAVSATIPIVRALWRVLGELFRTDIPLPAVALNLAYVVIGVGLLLAIASLLLRFKQYRDNTGPPSLTSALAITALGIGLAITGAIAGRSWTYSAQIAPGTSTRPAAAVGASSAPRLSDAGPGAIQ